MKIVMSQAVCPEGMALLDGVGEIWVADDPDPNHYLEQMRDADALILRLGRCDRHVIENSPDLKVIGRTGIGYDTVDVKAAAARGIPLVVTPGANVHSVAEHTLALIFALSKNLLEAHTQMCGGNWEIRNAGKAFELEGKTVGIVGLGPIGRDVCRMCLAVGLRAAAYDPFFTAEQISQLGAEPYEKLDELLGVSDFVSIHMPLVDATRDMITGRQLRLMKRSAILINCSRGAVVNEADLARALHEGIIAGAGVDVFCDEPPKPDDPLLRCPNILLTPHTAAQTREAVVRMARMCVNGCLAVCRGEKWPYVADKSAYDHPRWEGRPWAQV